VELSPTAVRALEAYGGAQLWRSARSVEAEVSAHGLAFTLKRRPAFDHARLTLDVARPYGRLTPIGRDPDVTGVLDGADVRLESASGVVLRERLNARQSFPYGRRLLFWDDLDMAYFAVYAFWNYLTLPRLLLNPDIAWEQTGEGDLKATFPGSIPTHSEVQEFRFDPSTGLLRQHNYTARVMGGFASAANVVTKHARQEGVLFASERRVTPRTAGGRARRGPLLIDLRIHRFHVTASAGPSDCKGRGDRI
jgi:hypothetical protein